MTYSILGIEKENIKLTPLKRAEQIIALLNTGDRKAAEVYIKNNYAPSFLLEVPLDQHLAFISQLHDNTQGIEACNIKQINDSEIEATVKTKLTNTLIALSIKIEPQSPHRITDLYYKDVKCNIGVSFSKKLSDFEEFVSKLAKADVFSGAILIAKNNKVLYKKVFGSANKDFNVPSTIDTKFNLGSMNKMFTAVAIAQLVESGQLSFDDPLSKFLPNIPNKEDAQKIKIKHLLSHTSGLGDYFNEKFEESSRKKFKTIDSMMTLIADEKLAFEPGTDWKYSNTGYLLLGEIIEIVTGKSYYDYIRDHIYQPAGMLNSDSYELDKVNHNLAVGYDKKFTENGFYFVNNIFDHVIRGGPAGGGYSTVDDLLKFGNALKNNKLLGSKYKEMLFTPKPELHSSNYGFGFSILKPGIIGHSGGFEGISGNLTLYLDKGYTVVVLSNYSNIGAYIFSRIDGLINEE